MGEIVVYIHELDLHQYRSGMRITGCSSSSVPRSSSGDDELGVTDFPTLGIVSNHTHPPSPVPLSISNSATPIELVEHSYIELAE